MPRRFPTLGIAFCAHLLIVIGLIGCNTGQSRWEYVAPNSDIYTIIYTYQHEDCVGWTLWTGGGTTDSGSDCNDATSSLPNGSAVLPGSGSFSGVSFSGQDQCPVRKTASAGADTLLLAQAFTGVEAFNLATGAKLATIPLPGNPLDLVPRPGQSTVYAVVYPASGASPSVAVIDAATLTLTATIALPANTFPICGAISPDGSTLYVSNAGSSSLSANPDTSILVIDTASQTVKGTIPFPASGNENLFGYYLRVAVSPDGTLLYASGSGGHLQAIDTLTQKPVSFIGLSPGLFLEASSPAPHIVFAPDGTKAYVGVGGPTGPSIVVIDPYTSQQVAAVRIGSSTSYLADIAISSNGSILYTVDESTGITYPIATAQQAV